MNFQGIIVTENDVITPVHTLMIWMENQYMVLTCQ